MNSSKVIDLNNIAVGFLRQGRHKQATDLLRWAIADLKNGFVDHKQGVDFSESSSSVSVNTMQPDDPSSSSSALFNDDADDDSSFIDVDQKQDKPAIRSVPLWTEESFEQKHDKSLIFMYARALELANIAHRREVLIGVVLYNMALANHAWAIEKEKSGLLMIALKFYGMAVAVVKGQYDVDVMAST
jgi:hypothetical protein